MLLFQDGKDSTVIGNLQHFFAQRIKEYEIAETDKNEKHDSRDRSDYSAIREQMVPPLTVRRTRRDLIEIRAGKRTSSSRESISRVEKPRPILYQPRPALDELYDRTVRMLSFPEQGGLTYNRY